MSIDAETLLNPHIYVKHKNYCVGKIQFLSMGHCGTLAAITEI
jgi:hypothetical protein